MAELNIPSAPRLKFVTSEIENLFQVNGKFIKEIVLRGGGEAYMDVFVSDENGKKTPHTVRYRLEITND